MNDFSLVKVALGASSLAGVTTLTILGRFGKGEVPYLLCRNFAPARKIADRLQPWFKSKIDHAALITSPEDASANFSFELVAASLTVVPFAVSTAHMNPATIISISILFVPFVHVFFQNIDKVRERKERIDSELPFFASLAAILSHAGMTLYDVFLTVVRYPMIFRQISREGKLLRRNVQVLGYGPVEALEAQAYGSPSEGYKRLILGTTSVWRTGGDVPTTLENRTEELIRETEIRFEKYAEQASGIGQILLVFFVLLMIGFITASLMFPSGALRTIDILSFSIVPLLTVTLSSLLKKAIPKKQDRYQIPLRWLVVGVTASALSATWAVSFGFPRALSAACLLMITSMAFSAIMRSQKNEVVSSERALQRFLRDVIEMSKSGATLTRAISLIARRGGYNRNFDRFLRRVAARIGLGRDIYESATENRSWLTRITFLLLKEIDEAGAAEPSLIEKVLDLVRNYEISVKKAASGLGLYVMLAFFTPVPLVVGAAAIGGLWESVGASGVPIRIGELGLATSSELTAVVSGSMLLIAESTAAYCFLAGYAVDRHPFGTWRVTVGMIMFLALYIFYPNFQRTFAELFRAQAVGSLT